ncbi:inositol 2-dehydrogenase [Breznakiella homolactica]|uniref:Inositol 2-dehydrogenase n=1 Tax=Breznakiella homolactica TaxID=2798577 RepID=A0A7T7XMR8_9SPIR|nr:inositol 2-dehydrogenase [Breznakiella homolactica]QQO09143.1 inositol 2-dehydrogenase [Breznakiella homolactica]
MAKQLRIGVLGAGRIGKIHAENIAYLISQAKLAGIADVKLTPEMETWAKGLGAQNVSGDPMEIIRDPAIEAIIICSSTDTHADLTIAAAEAGKHVFCEKPIDLTVSKVQAALGAVKKAGVKLQVGFNRRFDHNFRKIRELTLAGDIGEVQMVKITSRDPAPPPPAYAAVSGGIFMDMMIHDFDMARFQAGSEITEVYAAGAVLIDPEIGTAGDVDTAMVTLKFASGAIGSIDNSRKAVYGYDQRVEVFGSKGAAAAENDLPSTVRLSTEAGILHEKPLHFFLQRYKDAFADEMAAFVEAVLEDKPAPVSGEDGLADMYAALAAGKSLKEKRPVTIEEIRSGN